MKGMVAWKWVILFLILISVGCTINTISTTKKLPYDAKVVFSTNYKHSGFQEAVTVIYTPTQLEEEKLLEIAFTLKNDLRNIAFIRQGDIEIVLIFINEKDYEPGYETNYLYLVSRWDTHNYDEKRYASLAHTYGMIDYQSDISGSHLFQLYVNPDYYSIYNNKFWTCNDGICAWNVPLENVILSDDSVIVDGKLIRNETELLSQDFIRYDSVAID